MATYTYAWAYTRVYGEREVIKNRDQPPLTVCKVIELDLSPDKYLHNMGQNNTIVTV